MRVCRRVLEQGRFHPRARLSMMNRRPAVVLAAINNIYFVAAARPVEAARAMFSFKQEVRARLKINALRVATAVGEDFRARIAAAHKGIVGRNRAVIIQTQNLSGN